MTDEQLNLYNDITSFLENNTIEVLFEIVSKSIERKVKDCLDEVNVTQ